MTQHRFPRNEAIAAVAVSCAFAAAFADAPAQWLVLRDDESVSADAVLVLAGDPNYERTITASRLVTAGQVPLLLLTGGERGPGDSAESLRRVALSLGVPAERIRMEQVSHSTHEAMLAIAEIVEREGIRSLVVVTSPYHQRRAVWAARRTLSNVRVFSQPAESRLWRPKGWWKTRGGRRIVFREYVKLAYYGLRGWI